MDPLHQIIHSLTPPEKRYFTVFASAFKANNASLKLFEVLDKQEVYDEEIAKKKSGAKQFTQAKSELRKVLFKAMRNYREDVSIKQQLRDAISDVEFLERKNMQGEAIKELNKALKLAEKSNDHYYLIDLLLHSARNEATVGKPDLKIPLFDNLKNQLEYSISESGYFNRATMLSHYLSAVIRSSNYKTLSEIKDKIDVIAFELRDILVKIKSPYYKIILLTAIIFCNNEEETVKNECLQVMELYKVSPDLVEFDPVLYISFLNTYIHKVVMEAGNLRLSGDLLDKAEKAFSTHLEFLLRHPDRKKALWNKFNSMRLYHIRTSRNFSGLKVLEAEIKLQLEQDAEKKQVVDAINTSLLATCFLKSGNNEKAREWVNIYYALPGAAHRKALMISVRVSEVIVFYKTGQFDISENKAINLYKTLAEQQYQDDYHKLLGALLRKLNYWNFKSANHRIEVSAIRNDFLKMREAKNADYINYSAFIRPDEFLTELLKK